MLDSSPQVGQHPAALDCHLASNARSTEVAPDGSHVVSSDVSGSG